MQLPEVIQRPDRKGHAERVAGDAAGGAVPGLRTRNSSLAQEYATAGASVFPWFPPRRTSIDAFVAEKKGELFSSASECAVGVHSHVAFHFGILA